MKITKKQYNELVERIEELEKTLNGGKGSGNFGHAGRPGEVGGSAPEGFGGVSAKDAKAAEKKAQKAYDDYTDKHGFDQSKEAHELYKKYTDAKKATRLAERKELYSKTPKAKELVDGEQELHDIVDKYGKYETSTKAGQIITKLDDYSHTFEADTEGFYSRKNKDLTKKVLDHTQELQKIAKDIASDKKLSRSDKATLIDSVAALYSTLGSSIYSGGKFRADDDFTSSQTWTRLDSSDSLKGVAKQYAKRLRDLGDSTYDIYKAKEGGGKYYSWSDLLDKNSLHGRIENTIKTLDLILNGGKGSGNFGHSGRPGKVGGSSKEGGKLGSDENRKRGEARYKNQNVAHREMSYVMRAAHKGQRVSLGDVQDEPAIKEAFERAKFDKDTLAEHKGDKKREQLQKKLENRLLSNENSSFSGKDENGNEQFNGSVEQGKEAYIVIGRPAGGKSSVFANPLSKEHNARIIDSDTVKTWLPEFDDGFGAGRVQNESSMIMERALKRATDKGENVIIPKIGGESVADMARELKKKGYKVHLKYNEVSEASSITRALSRFVEKGRWLDPKYLASIGDKAEKFYKKYSKNKDLFDSAEWLNNDVKFGQKPKKVDRVD